jgi:hypothetical protein
MTELRRAINWAKDRTRYAQRELKRFDVTGSDSEAVSRTRRKLEADVARAQNDSAVLEHALAEQPPALSNCEAKTFVKGVEVAEDA